MARTMRLLFRREMSTAQLRFLKPAFQMAVVVEIHFIYCIQRNTPVHCEPCFETKFSLVKL